jgi:hypothetical protein
MPGVVASWLCRTCQGIAYRDWRHRRAGLSQALRRLDELDAIQHDLRVLRRVMLQELQDVPG